MNDEIFEYNEIKPLFSLLPKVPVKTKHKHEYQELCEELEPHYGKLVWTLPFKAGFTEHKLRKAHEVCQKRKIINYKYLYGVLKKLK